ncbi:uncharacterized protein LOC143281245 [Babylonia areolata]|uniref:uncharacterized protein LOC143281245 n=1 Tax=Babylonia areolata TaxID=304850 RepID=UPI003FD5FCA9
MKGHTVPWAFLPTLVQALLAIVLFVYVVWRTYHDPTLVRRWWPWLCGVCSVLLTPLLMGWLGFTAQGIQPKSLAAELQSLATGVPWLAQVVSALQSISTKGMGLKTAGVIFAMGGAFGRLGLPPAVEQLRVLIDVRQPAIAPDQNDEQGPRGPEVQRPQQPDPRHPHGE